MADVAVAFTGEKKERVWEIHLPGFCFCLLARFFQEAFFRGFCEKMRRARSSPASFPSFGNEAGSWHAALRKTTNPKTGAV
ncbi:MAG: hypothetical protein H7834_12960 [Magnetococcus sp. YQC-9]